MVCSNCRTQLEPGATKCPGCGALLVPREELEKRMRPAPMPTPRLSPNPSPEELLNPVTVSNEQPVNMPEPSPAKPQVIRIKKVVGTPTVVKVKTVHTVNTGAQVTPVVTQPVREVTPVVVETPTEQPVENIETLETITTPEVPVQTPQMEIEPEVLEELPTVEPTPTSEQPVEQAPVTPVTEESIEQVSPETPVQPVEPVAPTPETVVAPAVTEMPVTPVEQAPVETIQQPEVVQQPVVIQQPEITPEEKEPPIPVYLPGQEPKDPEPPAPIVVPVILPPGITGLEEQGEENDSEVLGAVTLNIPKEPIPEDQVFAPIEPVEPAQEPETVQPVAQTQPVVEGTPELTPIEFTQPIEIQQVQESIPQNDGIIASPGIEPFVPVEANNVIEPAAVPVEQTVQPITPVEPVAQQPEVVEAPVQEQQPEVTQTPPVVELQPEVPQMPPVVELQPQVPTSETPTPPVDLNQTIEQNGQAFPNMEAQVEPAPEQPTEQAKTPTVESQAQEGETKTEGNENPEGAENAEGAENTPSISPKEEEEKPPIDPLTMAQIKGERKILTQITIFLAFIFLGGYVAREYFPVSKVEVINTSADLVPEEIIANGVNNKVKSGDFIYEIPIDYLYDKRKDGLLITDKNNSWSIYIKTARQRYKYFQDNKDNISQVLINNSYIVNKGSGVIKAVGEDAQYLEYVITKNLNTKDSEGKNLKITKLVAIKDADEARESSVFYIEIIIYDESITAEDKLKVDTYANVLSIANDIINASTYDKIASSLEEINLTDEYGLIVSAADAYNRRIVKKENTN